MAKPNNAVAMNGSKYRSYEKPDTYWTDPLVENDFWSRTFMPLGTNFEEDQEEVEILKKVKNKKFKGSDLSDETKVKFKIAKIEYEDDQGENENE